MTYKRIVKHATTNVSVHGVGASGFEDKGNKSSASGYSGIDAQKLIHGSVLSGFNLLKIASTDILPVIAGGASVVTFNNANGTVLINCDSNHTAGFLQASKTALGTTPRIIVIRLNTNVDLADVLFFHIGLADANSNPTNFVSFGNDANNDYYPSFTTFDGTKTETLINQILSGDVFVIYATSTLCTLWKNGVQIAAHTTHIPTVALGLAADIYNYDGVSHSMGFDFLSS